MKIIEVIAKDGHYDTIAGIAEQQQVVDIWHGMVAEDGRSPVRMLVEADQVQAVLDALQAMFSGSTDYRVMVIPVEVALPRPPKKDDSDNDDKDSERDKSSNARAISREALYQQISKDTRLDSNYLLLVVLSTVVATVGMIENNVAVIVGAMVIAPLLGPNLALALGSALGDRPMVAQALKTAVAGVSLGIFTAVLIGLGWEMDGYSHELLVRTEVGMDSVALALASGAAAALSLSTGVSSVLVGVMVAVALLPPAAVVGLMAANGSWQLAGGAALLLGVNVASVNLAARIVFLSRGVRPRTWLEKQQTQQSALLSILLWVIFLVILVGAVLL